MSEQLDESILDRPSYPAAEAGRYIGLSATRVRRWLKGYSYTYEDRFVRQEPLINRTGGNATSYASFLDLIDLLFAKQFLNHGISLQQLRRALQEAASILNTRHFARQSFFTDGHKIYLEVKDKGDYLLELLSGGQWVIPDIIKELASQIQFDSKLGLARRWYPLGVDNFIVVDPLYSFGRPSIVHKGVTTDNVYDFYLAENREIRPACRWWNLTQDEVRAAVKFEERIVA